MNLIDFRDGDRIQLHPATDSWMRGDRYGEVLRVGRALLRVRMDSGRTLPVSPHDVYEIVERKP